MMTGVLHFMAISFSRIVVNQNLPPAQKAVNSRSRRLLLLLAMLGVSLAAIAISALGAEHGFDMTEAEDAGRFTDAILPQYKVVVFLSTTGDVQAAP